MTAAGRARWVAVVVALVATVVGTLSASAEATVGTGTTTVAVLGDSYVSGEGLPSAAGECGRTPDAWGVTVATAVGDEEPAVVACSGALVEDVTVGGGTDATAQLARVGGRVDLAVLVVGGNDLGFAELIAGCLDAAEQVEAGAFDRRATSTAWQDLVGSGRVGTGCDVDEAELLDDVASFADAERFPLPDGGTGRLADVHVAVAESVVADGGTLLVATYPSLFAPTSAWAERYGRRCHGVLADDADSFVRVTAALAARVREEAGIAAEQLGGRVTVVVADVRAAVAGEEEVDGVAADHGLCGQEEAWVNGLTLREGGLDLTAAAGALLRGADLDLATLGARPTASFHPNTAGHEAIARVALAALRDATTTD